MLLMLQKQNKADPFTLFLVFVSLEQGINLPLLRPFPAPNRMIRNLLEYPAPENFSVRITKELLRLEIIITKQVEPRIVMIWQDLSAKLASNFQ